jgi:glutamyl-Q tRNA(Asp) synthetase
MELRKLPPARPPPAPRGPGDENVPPVFRFAPSPNGELHLGHALSALVGFEMARAYGGRFLLRIEDIDIARCREELIEQIFDDLNWLGITWEEPVVRQSNRFTVYAKASATLMKLGLLYPCFATRSDIASATHGASPARDPEGAALYPGLHKTLPREDVAARIARDEPFALRLHMDLALDALETMTGARTVSFSEIQNDGRIERIVRDPAEWGDAVIVRKDVPASYHLAVVVDDAAQGVSHVTRGRDLFEATSLQRLLQILLGLPEPFYHHHALVTDAEGRKLSKSDRDTSLRELRGQGCDALQIRHRVGLAGTTQEIASATPK